MEGLTLEEKIIKNIMQHLQKSCRYHAIDDDSYMTLKEILLDTIESLYEEKNAVFRFAEFGEISFPYVSFGNINTKHLFGIDELIIFLYYGIKKEKYKVVLDLGANIGLHSLIMSKCFQEVHSYEPDSIHFKHLEKVMFDNCCSNVHLNKKAVSNIDGFVEFTRVKGNTTGSHISGSKENVYGDIEKFEVPCTSLETIILEKRPDFIKMDVEGQEANILTNTNIKYFENLDFMVEVGNPENAKLIFEYFKDTDIKLSSQKNGWREVKEVCDMPTSHKEGSLFISKEVMQWR